MVHKKKAFDLWQPDEHARGEHVSIQLFFRHSGTVVSVTADLPGKKRERKKGKGVKIEKKRRKILNGKVEN